MYDIETHHKLIECPRCKNNALVERGNQFRCLWCGFNRNTDNYMLNIDQLFGGLILFLVALLVVLLALKSPETGKEENALTSQESVAVLRQDML